MRKPVIAANWKMYKTPKESLAFLEKFMPLVKDHDRDEIVLFPTMSSLGYVLDATEGTNIRAGAQTMHWMNEGPYTGQTSPTMLASIRCTHVLLGHSERRTYAHETDDMVNWKLKAAFDAWADAGGVRGRVARQAAVRVDRGRARLADCMRAERRLRPMVRTKFDHCV